MRSITPVLNTSSQRGAYLRTGTNFTVTSLAVSYLGTQGEPLLKAPFNDVIYTQSRNNMAHGDVVYRRYQAFFRFQSIARSHGTHGM